MSSAQVVQQIRNSLFHMLKAEFKFWTLSCSKKRQYDFKLAKQAKPVKDYPPLKSCGKRLTDM